MWRILSALTFAAALFAGDAWAQMGGRGGHGHTVRSGVEAQVHLHRGMTERGLDDGKQFKVTRPPANGAARIVVTNLSSGTGKPIRVAQVFYRSKKGFTGSDSFSYQSIARNGAVQNFTLSVNVVP